MPKGAGRSFLVRPAPPPQHGFCAAVPALAPSILPWWRQSRLVGADPALAPPGRRRPRVLVAHARPVRGVVVLLPLDVERAGGLPAVVVLAVGPPLRKAL